MNVTDVTEVKGDFEVVGERERELGVEFKDVEEVVAVDFVDVAVGQSSYAAARFAHGRMPTHVLPEHIILA